MQQHAASTQKTHSKHAAIKGKGKDKGKGRVKGIE